MLSNYSMSYIFFSDGLMCQVPTWLLGCFLYFLCAITNLVWKEARYGKIQERKILLPVAFICIHCKISKCFKNISFDLHKNSLKQAGQIWLFSRQRERSSKCRDKCSMTERQRQLYLEMKRTRSQLWPCHFVTLDKSPNIYDSCIYSK